MTHEVIHLYHQSLYCRARHSIFLSTQFPLGSTFHLPPSPRLRLSSNLVFHSFISTLPQSLINSIIVRFIDTPVGDCPQNERQGIIFGFRHKRTSERFISHDNYHVTHGWLNSSASKPCVSIFLEDLKKVISSRDKTERVKVQTGGSVVQRKEEKKIKRRESGHLKPRGFKTGYTRDCDVQPLEHISFDEPHAQTL